VGSQDDDVQGHGRRAFLKRAGVVTGATVWATPTIQSLLSPAFATGTALCPPGRTVRFKYDVERNVFDSGAASGTGASWCLPEGYATAGNSLNGAGSTACITVDGKQYCVTVQMIDSKTAKVTVTGGALIEDLDAKAGAEHTLYDDNPRNDAECVDADISSGNTATVELARKDISFVAGVLCV
jgi:hypothetical protein